MDSLRTYRPRTKGWRLALALARARTAASAIAREELPLDLGLDRTRIGYSNHVGVIGGGVLTYWEHQLELSPEWQPASWLSLGAQLNLSQELAETGALAGEAFNGDVRLSDLLLGVASPGVTVPLVGLRVGGELQFVLPTSKDSQQSTLLAGLAPRLEVSRDFAFFGGLTLGYSATYVAYFHKFIAASICTAGWTCENVRNVQARVAHGPSLRFRPLRELTLAGTVQWTTAYLYPMQQSPYAEQDQLKRGPFLWFSASVDWRALDALSVEVGVTNDSFTLPAAARPGNARLKALVFLRLNLWPAELLRS